MYVVCVYDVNEKRCNKVMVLLQQYLFHVQNSVFEGELTPKKFQELSDKVHSIIDDEEDKIMFYYCYNNKQLYKSYLGVQQKLSNIID